MKTVTTEFTVEWADCDPAGIAFYPRYFAWFDAASWNLFYAVGLTYEVMTEEWKALGFPAVDAQASFIAPCLIKDTLTCTSRITA